MKKISVFYCIMLLAVFQLSCSDTLQRRYDQRNGTTSSSSRYDDDRDRRPSPNNTGKDAYKRDYDKMMEEDVKSDLAKTDYNQKLVTQYEDMDKTGELVLYELDILESRWNVLIAEYKGAGQSSRQVISEELDKIGEDRILLYKAYTNIYKNGKLNWLTVKQEVENSLRRVRKVDR